MRLAVLFLPVLLTGCLTVGGAPVVSGSGGTVGAPNGVGVAGGGVAAPALADLPRADRARALAAEYQALEFQSVGEPIEWQGAKGSGAASALAPFRVGSQNCRQLIHTITVDGTERTERGSACREPDGTWTPLA